MIGRFDVLRYGSFAALVLLPGCGGSSESFGPAASLSVVSGDHQEAQVGTELPDPIVVRVTDADGRPVPNQIVNFVIVSGGGSVFGGTSQTNADGEARERWTLDTLVGEQTIEARAVDQATGAAIVFGRITATALPGPLKYLFPDYDVRIWVGEPLDLASIMHATDQYNNIIPDPPLTAVTEPPFTLQGTVLTSSSEVGGTVVVTSGDLSRSVDITAFRNLTGLVGATGGWACEGSYWGSDPDYQGATHETVTFVVDSVRYPFFPRGYQFELWTTATAVWTFPDHTTTNTFIWALPAEQHLRRLEWAWPEGPLAGSAQLISESPLSYRGGTPCYQWTVTSAEEFSMSLAP